MSSDSSAYRENPHAATFKATFWWNSAVEHLVMTMATIKPDKKLAVASGHSGRFITDVMWNFASADENRQNFTVSELSRQKIVNLCQVMLDCRVILSHGDKKFRDSHSHYYSASSPVSSNGFSMSPMQHFSSALLTRLDSAGSRVPKQSNKLKPEKLRFHDVISPFARLKVHPGDGSSDLSDGSQLASKSVTFPQISSSPSKVAGALGLNLATHILSPGRKEELDWFPFEEMLNDSLIHDLALFRLLTLIDLPVLDNILHVKDKILPKAIEQIFSGSAKRSARKHFPIPGCEETPKLIKSADGDSWVLAGAKCADLSGRSLDDLVSLSPLHRRQFVFSKVAEFHRGLSAPLIPQNYNDISKQIFVLRHQQQKCTVAIEAAQLLMLLLPRDTRVQLRNLLAFMMLISQDRTTRICDELSNMDAVLNTFGTAVLQCCDAELSRPHYLGLLEFLVVNWEEIFLVPASFRDEVKNRLERQKYTTSVPVPSLTYCSRISATDFSREAKVISDAELISLVNAVVDDTKLSRNYKESFLEKFRLEHPSLYQSKLFDLK